MADVRQMRANLMRSPRHQLNLKPRIFPRLQHPIAGNDFKRPSGRVIRHRNAGKLRVFPQIRMHDRFTFGWAALGSAGIEFFHRPLFKRFSSRFIGRVVLGQQKQTAGLYIQPMAKPNPVCFFALSLFIRHHAGQHAVPRQADFPHSVPEFPCGLLTRMICSSSKTIGRAGLLCPCEATTSFGQ